MQAEGSSEKKLLTVKQFCKVGQWPSESALRTIILDAAWGRNNFQAAFKRVKRRVLVDEAEFWQCVERMQKVSNDAHK